MTLPHCQTTAKSLPSGTLLPVLPAPIYKAQQLAVGVAVPEKQSTTHRVDACPICGRTGEGEGRQICLGSLLGLIAQSRVRKAAFRLYESNSQ